MNQVHFNSQPGWCEELYRSKAAELLLYGRALGLSHAESEDVLHETFVALMRRATAPEDPVHYCLRAFRNRALNFKRSLWRRIAREFESRRWFERSDAPGPDEDLAMRALSQLPSEQREVIVLKIWHEYTFEQIGELTGTSANTISGRYRYGLQKLRNICGSNSYEREQSVGEPTPLMGATPPVPEA